ncbi:hypothetical protein DFH06DRAFT_1125474 [Mycena polygramma]|nr:hypothetical protein DFH06DRAFT_1125474 [Mycena polygramma]
MGYFLDVVLPQAMPLDRAPCVVYKASPLSTGPDKLLDGQFRRKFKCPGKKALLVSTQGMYELQRCDGERPVCQRCRLQPPRSLAPCKYSHAPAGGVSSEEETMTAMRHGLEQDPARVLLSDPYAIPPSQRQRVRPGAEHQFFFLDPAAFKQSAPFPQPFGRPDRLPRGLLNAVSLWATHISPTSVAHGPYSEDERLNRTVHSLTHHVAIVDLPQHQHTTYLIQAQVLLSLYYLDSGNLVQGNYHCAGATSLALTAGLHQLGTPSQAPYPPQVSLSMTPATAVSAPSNELINAFWSVVLLNNYFVAASGAPSSIPCDTPIRTPWPTDKSYTPFTVHGHYPLTRLTKASILLERTISFTTRNSSLPNSPQFRQIGKWLESFRSNLPPLDAAVPISQVSLVTHALVYSAIVRLYAPHSPTCVTARCKCLTAASYIAARLVDTHIVEWEHIDPILGPLLAAFADVLIENLPYGAPVGDLNTILSVMYSLAHRSPLIRMYPSAVKVVASDLPRLLLAPDQCLEATQQRYTAFQQIPGVVAQE